MSNSIHAVITGGTSGIGLSITRALLSEGYKVSVCSRRAKSNHEIFSDELKEGNLQLLNVDVSSRSEVEQAFKEATKAFGTVSVLINNAGQASSSPFEKSNSEIFSSMLSINLMSVIHCSQLVINDMRAQKFGRIINIVSTAGLKGYAYTSAYCASKHAVIGLSKSMALEFATTGITVNNICPGFTNTPLAQDAIKNIIEKTKMTTEQATQSLVKFNPMNRLINPEEIAHTAVWLASKGAKSITGQSISVSGGEVMLS